MANRLLFLCSHKPPTSFRVSLLTSPDPCTFIRPLPSSIHRSAPPPPPTPSAPAPPRTPSTPLGPPPSPFRFPPSSIPLRPSLPLPFTPSPHRPTSRSPLSLPPGQLPAIDPPRPSAMTCSARPSPSRPGSPEVRARARARACNEIMYTIMRLTATSPAHRGRRPVCVCARVCVMTYKTSPAHRGRRPGPARRGPRARLPASGS